MRGRLIKARNLVPKSGAVTVGPSAVLSAIGASPEAAASIAMKKDGDRIMAIEFGCPCGRHFEFECQYELGAGSATPVAAGAPGERP